MYSLLLLACVANVPKDDVGTDDTDSGSGDSGSSDSGSGDSGSGDSGDPEHLTPGRYFPDGAPWYQDVSDAPLDPDNDAIIGFLQDHGWGNGRFQMDFSIEVLDTTSEATFREFDPARGYFWSPDCDQAPVPVPDGGAVEGESDYQCRSGGDCHLLVAYQPTMELFELYHADIRGETFTSGCLAVWDMTRLYPPEGRGEQCTSADAAGFPITPLLFTADEVAAGSIDHAIRFILPNETMRAGVYVRPATHAGSPSAASPAPPYGVRLRLRADYPLDSLRNDGARVVARALQQYGMLLADGGNITVTARSDRSTTAKWDGLLGSRDLDELRPDDFEVVEMGDTYDLTYDCVRAD